MFRAAVMTSIALLGLSTTAAFAGRGDYHNPRGGYDRGSRYDGGGGGGYRSYGGGYHGGSRSSFGLSFGYSNYGGYGGSSFGFGYSRGYAPRPFVPAPRVYVPAPRIYAPAPVYVAPPPVIIAPAPRVYYSQTYVEPSCPPTYSYGGSYYSGGYTTYDGGGYYCR